MTATSLIWRSASIWFGLLFCTAAIGGFLAWAAIAPLAEGVVVYGKVSVERERKVVQHLEGGIIQELLISEGDTVELGQPLIILADLAVTAGRDQVAAELANAKATKQRLEALLDNERELQFEGLDVLEISQTELDDIQRRQEQLFLQQRQSLQTELSVLSTRRSALGDRAASLQTQISTTSEAQALIDQDIARNTQLLEQRLIRASELEELKRRSVEIESDLIQLNSNLASSRSEAVEVGQQISQRRASFLEDVNDQLVAANAELRTIEEKLIAAEDVVDRTVISAPQSGRILNLEFTTIGGVISSGQPILEIVPTAQGIVAVVEIEPVDRDNIVEGQLVEARLSGSSTWTSPLLSGTVEQISADLKLSPRGDYSFYEATISIDPESVSELDEMPLPGMPVEAFVFSGESRTFVDYLLEPILATFRRGARD